MRQRPSLAESMGLLPPRLAFEQALVALRGAEDVPPSRFGLSSLRLVDPKLGPRLWAGRFVVPRRAILTNLFNHRQTPIELGWSVEKTQVEDFRGKGSTYDSHNGTDFCIPLGTPVVAPAAAVVVRVHREFNRGGLKVVLDHGGGLMTASAHLARSLVEEGQVLRLGQPFALSGYSGLDALVTFPWGVPHVHFNVWLGGVPVDPFARRGTTEPSLWVGGTPRPSTTVEGLEPASSFEPSRYDERLVAEAIDACVTPSVREQLRAVEPLARRAGHLVGERCYYPTRFPLRGSVYAEPSIRAERLFLPFSADQFDGVVFADEL